MLDPKEVSAEDGRRYLEDRNSLRYVIVNETSRCLCSIWDGGYIQTGWEALKTLKDLQKYSDEDERKGQYFLYRIPDSVVLKSNGDFTEDVVRDRENWERFDRFLQNRDPNQADAVIFPEREDPSTFTGYSRPFFFSESFRKDLQSQFVSLPERAVYEDFPGDYWEPPYTSLKYEDEHEPEFCNQIFPGCAICSESNFIEDEKDSPFGETRWSLSLPKNKADRPNLIQRAQTGYILYNETLDQDLREDGIGPFFDPHEAQNMLANILDDPGQYSPEFLGDLKNRMACLVPGDTFTCQYGILSCSDVLAKQGASKGWEEGYHDIPYLLSPGVSAQVSFQNPRCQGIGRTTATVVREPGKELSFVFDQNANFSPEFQDLMVDHEACRRMEETMKHSGKPIDKVAQAAGQVPENGKEEKKERTTS